jgi:hypothetical protein
MNVAQFTAPAHAAFETDESLTALALSSQLVAGGLLLSVVLPPGVARTRLAGRYFLARCGEPSPWGRAHDWAFYLRRPIFAAAWRPCHQRTRRALAAEQRQRAPILASAGWPRGRRQRRSTWSGRWATASSCRRARVILPS